MAVWQLQPRVSLSIASPAISRHVPRPKRLWVWFSLTLTLSLFFWFYRTIHFNTKKKTEWCTDDTSRSDGGTFLNGPIKHATCLVRLFWHCVSESPTMSLWGGETEVLSLPLSNGQSCQEFLIKDAEGTTDKKKNKTGFMMRNRQIWGESVWIYYLNIYPSE